MANNPQTSAAQPFRPPPVAPMGPQSFGSSPLQYRPVVPTQQGQQFIPPAPQQFHPVGQGQVSLVILIRHRRCLCNTCRQGLLHLSHHSLSNLSHLLITKCLECLILPHMCSLRLRMPSHKIMSIHSFSRCLKCKRMLYLLQDSLGCPLVIRVQQFLHQYSSLANNLQALLPQILL